MDKTEFEIVVDGTIYNLPIYEVVGGKGIELTGEVSKITFVRGSKLGSDSVPKISGILHETLLAMMIHDLTLKNELVKSEDTNYTIQCLEEALHSCQRRQKDREERNVEGTYSK